MLAENDGSDEERQTNQPLAIEEAERLTAADQGRQRRDEDSSRSAVRQVLPDSGRAKPRSSPQEEKQQERSLLEDTQGA